MRFSFVFKWQNLAVAKTFIKKRQKRMMKRSEESTRPSGCQNRSEVLLK
jgi:hypothetical protein